MKKVIKIDKAAKAPRILSQRGRTEATTLCGNYESDPAGHDDGSIRPKIRRNIYAAESVKSALQKCHYGKCCYTEMKVRGYGHVEHFRPKGAFRRRRGGQRLYPGYYWLAYSWENLYWCSQIYNIEKSDIFPLERGSYAARSHNDDVARERPVLIDPGIDDPRAHIRFRGDVPIGITGRGKSTIELLRLRTEPQLVEARLKHLGELQFRIDVITACTGSGEHADLVNEAAAYLTSAVEPGAEFSSMATDYLSERMPDLIRHCADVR